MLQVALDFWVSKADVQRRIKVEGLDREAALQAEIARVFERMAWVAEQSVLGGADIAECGTPTMKAFGCLHDGRYSLHNFVASLRENHPHVQICLDTKTMDVGALEVELGHLIGADYITVEATASLETLVEALRRAEELGMKLIVSTTGRGRALGLKELEEICSLRPAFILFHLAIDEQGRLKVADLLEEQKLELLRKHGVGLGVAGGLNLQRIEELKPFARQIDLWVIGGAITKAANPQEATAELKVAIEQIQSSS